MEITVGKLYVAAKKFPGKLFINTGTTKMSLEKYLEYRQLVINGFNEIAVDEKAPRKTRERAKFLLGCMFGCEKYVDEDYDPKAIVNAQKRRARKRKTISNLTIDQWKEIKSRFDDSCAYCGENKELSQDHFIPLIDGGDYTYKNIVPACRRCNSSKRDRKFEEWYHTKPFYDEIREKKILEHVR